MAVVLSSAVYLILIISVLFVVYRLIYSYQVNKALATGKQVKTITPASMILSVVIGILLLMNIFQFNYIQDVWSDLSQTRTQLNTITNTMNDKFEDLSQQLSEKALNTYDVSLDYNGMKDEKVLFDLSFKIKSVETGSAITILVEDLDGDIEEYSVTQEGIEYSTTLPLPFDGQYKVYMKSISPQSTYIELINVWDPQEVLGARFELYNEPNVRYHENYIEINFHNGIGIMKNILTGLQVDYIRVQYIAHDLDNKEQYEDTILITDFTMDEGSNYLGDSHHIEAIAQLTHTLEEDYDVSIFITIVDKDGNYYTFNPVPNYTTQDLSEE